MRTKSRWAPIFYLMVLASVLLLGLFILAGCGGGGEENGAQEEQTEDVSLADLFSSAKQVSGMSYEYVLTDPNTGTTMQGNVWLQGNKQRVETTAPTGEEMVTIINGEENVAYTYMPQQNLAYKVQIAEVEEAETPNDYVNDVDPVDAKMLGMDVIDGKDCYIWNIGVNDESYDAKMWVSKEYGIPVRIETSINGGEPTVLEYKNLQVGDIAAETFELPDSVQVTDINDMLKDLQQSMP